MRRCTRKAGWEASRRAARAGAACWRERPARRRVTAARFAQPAQMTRRPVIKWRCSSTRRVARPPSARGTPQAVPPSAVCCQPSVSNDVALCTVSRLLRPHSRAERRHGRPSRQAGAAAASRRAALRDRRAAVSGVRAASGWQGRRCPQCRLVLRRQLQRQRRLQRRDRGRADCAARHVAACASGCGKGDSGCCCRSRRVVAALRRCVLRTLQPAPAAHASALAAPGPRETAGKTPDAAPNAPSRHLYHAHRSQTARCWRRLRAPEPGQLRAGRRHGIRGSGASPPPHFAGGTRPLSLR